MWNCIEVGNYFNWSNDMSLRPIKNEYSKKNCQKKESY